MECEFSFCLTTECHGVCSPSTNIFENKIFELRRHLKNREKDTYSLSSDIIQVAFALEIVDYI